MLYNRYLVRINYKSGNSVEGWFYNIEADRQNSEITNIKWLECGRWQLMFAGMANIESMHQLKQRRGILGHRKVK